METKPHLYIITIKDSDYFKIGYTSRPNFKRVLQHNKTFLLDEDFIIYEGDNVYSIRLLEESIKHEFSQHVINEELRGKDGYTEIRDKGIYGNVIEFIDKSFQHLGLEKREISLKDIIIEKPVIISKEEIDNDWKEIEKEIIDEKRQNWVSECEKVFNKRRVEETKNYIKHSNDYTLDNKQLTLISMYDKEEVTIDPNTLLGEDPNNNLFTDLKFINNEGMGWYDLVYSNNHRKIVFYEDFSDIDFDDLNHPDYPISESPLYDVMNNTGKCKRVKNTTKELLGGTPLIMDKDTQEYFWAIMQVQEIEVMYNWDIETLHSCESIYYVDIHNTDVDEKTLLIQEEIIEGSKEEFDRVAKKLEMYI
jgi:hypothetical protein